MANFNIIQEGWLENSSTVSGTVQLTTAQLAAIIDGNTSTAALTISGSESFVLDVDLGMRYSIGEIRYYCNPVTTNGVSIQTSISGSSYTTETPTISGSYLSVSSFSVSDPQYVRLIHDLSGTGIATASGIEFQILNTDDVVDFGTDGALTTTTVSDAPIGYESSTATTVPVYNDSDEAADAIVFIESTGTDADDMILLSASEDGTYVGRKSYNYMPDATAWSYGLFENTMVSGTSIVMETTLTQSDVDNGLQLEALMETGTGSAVYDTSSNGNNGTITDAAWITTTFSDNSDYALEFNGSSAAVSFGNPAALQITGSLTITGWAWAGRGASGTEPIVSKWNAGLSEKGFMLSLEGGKLRFSISSDGSAVHYTETSMNVDNNDWYFVAAVYNATNQTVDLFVNGTKVADVSTSGTIPSSIHNSTADLIIGSEDSGTNFLEGYVDSVRVYNRAVSDIDVKGLMWVDVLGVGIGRYTTPVFDLLYSNNAACIEWDSVEQGSSEISYSAGSAVSDVEVRTSGTAPTYNNYSCEYLNDWPKYKEVIAGQTISNQNYEIVRVPHYKGTEASFLCTISGTTINGVRSRFGNSAPAAYHTWDCRDLTNFDINPVRCKADTANTSLLEVGCTIEDMVIGCDTSGYLWRYDITNNTLERASSRYDSLFSDCDYNTNYNVGCSEGPYADRLYFLFKRNSGNYYDLLEVNPSNFSSLTKHSNVYAMGGTVNALGPMTYIPALGKFYSFRAVSTIGNREMYAIDDSTWANDSDYNFWYSTTIPLFEANPGLGDGWRSRDIQYSTELNAFYFICHYGASATLPDVRIYIANGPYCVSWSSGEFPAGDDTTWGISGTNTWDEVVGNGTDILPQGRYAQARFTFRADGSISPSLSSITIPRGVTLSGIGTRSYKNLYIKTLVPTGSDTSTRTGGLKVYWDATS